MGKAPGRHTMTQEDICDLLVERGRAGQTVVRLKGGDPFVFARGGEEAAALAEAGVAYEVVPGITSALAVPASAGIPVTLRYSSTSFTVVTGHEDPDSTTTVDWDAIAQVGGTIVILMAVARWPAISERLIQAGLDASTPAAAVQWGTRPVQRTVRATLVDAGGPRPRGPVGDRRRRGRGAGARLVRAPPAVRDGRWSSRGPGARPRSVLPAARARRGGRRGAGHRDRRGRPTEARRGGTRRRGSGPTTGSCSRRSTASTASSPRSPTPGPLGGVPGRGHRARHRRRAAALPGGRRPGARGVRGRVAARRHAGRPDRSHRPGAPGPGRGRP